MQKESNAKSNFSLPPSVSTQAYDAVCHSVFFDLEFYLQAYPDVAASGMDPALHYLLHGGSEGRNPGPRFSTSQYLVQNPDVAAAGVNALVHYELQGQREGRTVPYPRLPQNQPRPRQVPERLIRNHRHISDEALRRIERSIRTDYQGDPREEPNYNAEVYAQVLSADLKAHLTVRLESDRDMIAPWLDAVRPLEGLRILEVGCGTGSATVALGEQGADVTGLDIYDGALAVARERCAAYGVSAKLRLGNAEKMLEMFGTGGFDTIIFFASLEHMTISERLVSLRDAWTMLPSGGHLIIIETPNRLWLVDTHTAQLPFYHWLPDELAFHYARMSPRPRFRTMYDTYETTSKLRFLRDGRGMSYHELDLAIGPSEDLQVINSLGIFDHSKLRKWRGNPDSDVGSAYQAILRCVRPDLHTGFFEEWLDIIIRKP